MEKACTLTRDSNNPRQNRFGQDNNEGNQTEAKNSHFSLDCFLLWFVFIMNKINISLINSQG